MTYPRLVISAGLLLLFAQATTADAQIELLSRTALPAPDSTIDRLTKRIEALENTLAQLQQKIAFIKSVSPLVFDAGGDLSIRGGQISLDAAGAFNMRAGTTIGLTAGTDLNLRSTSNATIRSSGQMLVESAAILDLKGSAVRHNGGSVPILCAASTVNGQTSAGGGLRGDHTHTVALPVAPCSATVGVPGPGQ